LEERVTIALYPGTFDPVHFGHVDIARRTAGLFSELIVGVYDRPSKQILFSTEQRVAMCREALSGLSNVQVRAYHGLTVDFAREIEAQVVVRGLRALSDFEFEFHMALMNKKLAPDIEFVCLMTSLDYAYLSATTLKEIAFLGGDICSLAPDHVQKALQSQFAETGDDLEPPVKLSTLRD
jgi:pantetheine-phosphate adenylyltransferase